MKVMNVILKIKQQISQLVVVAIDKICRWDEHNPKPVRTKVPSTLANHGLTIAKMFFHEWREDKCGGLGLGQSLFSTSLHRQQEISTQWAEKASRLFLTLRIPRCGSTALIVRIGFVGLLFSLCSSLICFSETIDRIVAVVNNQIITLSDLEGEERFYQFDHHLQSSNKDNSTNEKTIQRELLERMIERLLLSEQISGFPGSKITDEEIEAQLNALQEKWGGKDAMDQVLVQSHTTREELKEHLRWQIMVLKYVDNRFRQFAVIDPAEISTYYQKMLIPELERKGIRQFPPQSEVETKIREILTEEKVNQAIEEWLASLKETANIHIFE